MPYELLAAERKPRLLWCGDIVATTGFARVSEHILAHLHADWDIHVLGINWHGDYCGLPYQMYPASPGGDPWGHGRYQALVEQIQPDVVVLLNDPWIVRKFVDLHQTLMEKMEKMGKIGTMPLVAYMPIDAPNIAEAKALAEGLDLAIWYTEWAQHEAERCGYTGPSLVIPHGVDLAQYYPMDRGACRRALGIPEDAYIVGNVGRNQPRKRLDLSLLYVAEWIRREPIDHAYLYLHCATRDVGIDLLQLADYWGLQERLLLTGRGTKAIAGVPEDTLRTIYNAFDVQINTSQGEGWGLPTMEGMACGIPQLAGDYAGLGDWAQGAAHLIPCTSYAVTPRGINTVGGIPDQEGFINGLQALYEMPEHRAWLGAQGLQRVQQERFRWASIAARFHVALTAVLQDKEPVDAALR